MRINNRIQVREVRLIDQDNNQVGVVAIRDALSMAQEAELDLVEVSPNAEPPVCRIMDYGKYLYQQKRKLKLSQKKQHVVSVKERRLQPGIGTHDKDIKIAQARKFIEKGDKVQFTLKFKGREMIHLDANNELLSDIQSQLEDIAKVERMPNLIGKRMIMILTPK